MTKVEEKKELTDLINAVRELMNILPDDEDHIDLAKAWTAYEEKIKKENDPKLELDNLMSQWKNTRAITPSEGVDFGGYGEDGCPYCGSKGS